MSYGPPTGELDASWVGAPAYLAPYSVVPGAWGGAGLALYPIGVPPGQVGTPPLVTKQQFAAPSGWRSSSVQAPLITRDGEYVAPYATVHAGWLGAGEYTPSGGALDVSWQVTQSGDDQYVYGAGIDTGAIGEPFVTKQQFIAAAGWGGERFGRVRAHRAGEYLPPFADLDATWVSTGDYIHPAGFVLARWGNLLANSIRPVGRVHATFGRPALLNQHQWVIPYSLDAFEGFGEHWVSLGQRRVYAGLGDQSAFGRAELSGGTRWLDMAGRGIAGASYGRPTTWFREREVFPAWFVATQYGQGQVDRHHGVEPTGFEASDFGWPEVHVPRDYVDLAGLGIAGPLWGEHVARNAVEYLRPNGIGPWPGEHERFGRPETQLWTRYVQQLYEVTPNDGGVFGTFNYVENRDKVPRPEGWDAARYGTPEVRNNARIVTTPPHQDMSLWGDTLVAYRIRTIRPQGDDTSQWGSPLGNIIYNAARVLAPAGIEAGAVGTPERVWSNLQWMDHAGGDEHAEIGDTMVAFAIRTVAPYSLPEPPSAGFATVQHWQRYVAPPGLDAGGRGVPTLEEHFTIVAPKSALPPVGQVGDGARVWNLTPELHQMGAVHTEWGRAAVFNEWEAYAFEGFRSTEWGRHVVRDRRSWIAPASITRLTFGPRTEVRNVDPDPPGPQTVQPGSGTSPDSGFGKPIVSSNVLFHQQADVFTSFGTPGLVRMGITPIPILPPADEVTGSQFGVPYIPNTQVVTQKNEDGPSTAWGEPHLWPHIIWAPQGYPYNTGKDGEKGHVMDAMLHGGVTSRPVFGRAVVTLQNRTLAHGHSAPGYGVFTQYGEPLLGLNPQYLGMEGARFQRLGIPVVWGGDQGIQHYGRDHAEVGQPALAHDDIGPRRANPAGIAPVGFGTHRVEFFNREVAPSGFIAFQISAPRPPSWPRESTWVSHAYPPFEMVGFDATLWGTTWVSHRIRHLEPDGWDSAIVSDYEPGYFKLRMRVRRNDYVRDAGAGAQGGIGRAEVTHGTRGLLVRGVHDGRVGVPATRAVWTVAAPGWDSQVFGDIDRWEAGTIKAHGDDLAGYGRAVIHRALHAGGFDAATFGTPGIGRRIEPAGFDAALVAVPAAIGGGCCNSGDRVAAPAGFDATGFGVPNIGDELAAVIGAGEIRPAGWLATNPGVGTSFAGHNVTQTQPKRQETENA